MDVKFSNYQKNEIYKTMLLPMKLQISEILLYDSESAIKFLKEYNQITKNANDEKIMDNINSLELKLKEYQNSKGKIKKFEGQAQAILQDIEELKMKNYQLTIDEFLDAFATLKEKYNKIGSYNFEEKDIIENELSKLQLTLITRFSNEKRYSDLHEIIPEEDKIGLNIAISGKINEFLQSEDLRVKNKAQKISNIMITNDNALYSQTLWQLLEELQTGKNQDNNRISVDTTSTALTVVPQNKKMSFLEKITRFFSKEPQLPLQVQDLRKIDIDWLAKHVPQSMLEEIEIKRLKEEGKKVKKLFIPDAKTPIYDMFREIDNREVIRQTKENYSHPKRYGEFMKKTEYLYENEFIDSRDIKKRIDIFEERVYKSEEGESLCFEYAAKLRISSGEEEVIKKFLYKCHWMVITSIKYTQLIDTILGTNWEKILYEEIIEECCMRYPEKEWISSDTLKKCKTIKALLESYMKMEKEYEKTKLDFRGKEKSQRDTFYKKDNFVQNLRKEDYNINHSISEKYIQDNQKLEQTDERVD